MECLIAHSYKATMDSKSNSDNSDLKLLAEKNSGAAIVVALAATTASKETSVKHRDGSKPG